MDNGNEAGVVLHVSMPAAFLVTVVTQIEVTTPLPPTAADLTANRMPTGICWEVSRADHDDLARNLVLFMRKHNREQDGQAVWFTFAEIMVHRRFQRFGETEVRECLRNAWRRGHKRFDCFWVQ